MVRTVLRLFLYWKPPRSHSAKTAAGNILADSFFIIFVRLYAAHICGDILTYFPRLAGQKRVDILSAKIKAIAVHCLIHGLWVWVWGWGWPPRSRLLAVIFIFGLHFLIDFSRGYLENAIIGTANLEILKRQQIWLWLRRRGDPTTNKFMGKYLGKWISINLADQTLHLIAVTFVTVLLRLD